MNKNPHRVRIASTFTHGDTLTLYAANGTQYSARIVRRVGWFEAICNFFLCL